MKTISCFISITFLLLSLSLRSQSNTKFTRSEIILETSSGALYGSLVIPDDLQSSPLVIIIPGSGPTDRNGNNNMGIQTNAYKMLAENFGNNGISTLRFDKRGIAQSKSAAKSESELRFDTYIDDLVDWISLVKKDNRFSEIILLGHSEGSLIGIIAAQKTEIDAFISLAGSGQSIDKTLKEQLVKQFPLPINEESNRIIDSLKKGKLVKNIDPNFRLLYRESVQPYLISWMKYDPVNEIIKLKMPVFIIQGLTDLQVTENDARKLNAAKPDSKLLLISKMNHVLKDSEADQMSNMATYRNPELPLNTELTDALIRFIKTKK